MLMPYWFLRLWARLRVLFGGRRLEREFDAELQFHLDQQASEYQKAGDVVGGGGTCRACRARQRAAAPGGCPRGLEMALARSTVAGRPVRHTHADTQPAGSPRCRWRRSLSPSGPRRPSSALSGGILLRPLPVAEPERLVRIVNIAYIGELVELRARSRTLDVGAYLPPDDRTLTGFDDPLRLSVVAVTGDLLTRLRQDAGARSRIRSRRRAPPRQSRPRSSVTPCGVNVSARIPRRSAEPCCSTAWYTRCGGVMPPDFEFPSAGVDLWVPMTVDVTNRVGLWARMGYLIGRLRRGVTLDAATSEVRALGPQSSANCFPWRMPDGHGTDVSLRTWRGGPAG